MQEKPIICCICVAEVEVRIKKFDETIYLL